MTCLCNCHASAGAHKLACNLDKGSSGVEGLLSCSPCAYHEATESVPATPTDNTTVQDVWAAVSALIDPQEVRMTRAADADWLAELADPETKQRACLVASYRAATSGHATIPSLWDQATVALSTGVEGGSGSKPLRERSPADLDLMEVRMIIRDTTRHELENRGVATEHDDKGRMVPFQPAEIRHLVSLVIAEQPPSLYWWQYRIQSWARMLSTYLRAFEHQPKPIRLRAPCPLCKTERIVIEGDMGPVVARPIVIDFRDGAVRAATCEACGAAWFRGADLEALADLVDPTRQTSVVAETA